MHGDEFYPNFFTLEFQMKLIQILHKNYGSRHYLLDTSLNIIKHMQVTVHDTVYKSSFHLLPTEFYRNPVQGEKIIVKSA